jgi:hypothetical protein
LPSFLSVRGAWVASALMTALRTASFCTHADDSAVDGFLLRRPPQPTAWCCVRVDDTTGADIYVCARVDTTEGDLSCPHSSVRGAWMRPWLSMIATAGADIDDFSCIRVVGGSAADGLFAPALMMVLLRTADGFVCPRRCCEGLELRPHR